MKLLKYLRVRHIFKCIFFLFWDSFAKKEKHITSNKNLLLIKTDVIGDYILFRNFIQLLKESEKYSDYSIYLLCNEIWLDLSVKLDNAYVSAHIPIKKNLFKSSIKYRNEIIEKVNSIGFDTIINCAYSREFLLGDSIIRMTNATNKIGMIGDSASELAPFNFIGSLFYTRLVKNDKIFFEFYKNRHFFSEVIGEKIHVYKPYININVTRENIAIISPGAQAAFRQWSPENFKAVGEFIFSKYGYKIIIIGASNERKIAQLLIDGSNKDYFTNLCGETNISELPELIAKAKLLICNDSGAMHIAASVNTHTICISNANHFLRFTPYPKEIGLPMTSIYPKSFYKIYKSDEHTYNKMKNGSSLDINEISTMEVINQIEVLLSKNENYSH
jgi:ADP-heptose:LPS heptosyltransferase